MKKVIVSLMVLSLVPALATAAITNPEEFEGYDPTADWQPTEAGEGWEVLSGPVDIGTAFGRTGKGLGLAGDTPNDPETAPDNKVTWYGVLDAATVPLQIFTIDFKTTPDSANRERLGMSLGDPNYGGSYQGVFSFETRPDSHGTTVFGHYDVATDAYIQTPFPDGDVGHDGQWHTATVEMDFTTHTVRGKLDDYEFTAWVVMPDGDHTAMPGPAYSYAGLVIAANNGFASIDNISLVPEPATMVLLGLGGVGLLIRRRRRA